MELDYRMSKIIEIITKSIDIIMNYYQKDFEVFYKDRNEPFTLADRESDAFITSQIKKYFPSEFILSEELNKNIPQDTQTFWCVDPIDGTQDFIMKDDEFSVMIAYIEKGEIQYGGLGLPASKQILIAKKNQGSFLLENINNNLKPLLTNKFHKPFSDFTAIHSRNHIRSDTLKLFDKLGINKRIACGSVGVKISRIVSGEADIYIQNSKYTKLWDTAAPQIILQESGGYFSNLLGETLTYSGNSIYNQNGIFASSFNCFDDFLKITRT